VVRVAIVESSRFSTSFISSIFNIDSFECLIYWDFKSLFLFWVDVGEISNSFMKMYFLFSFGNNNLCEGVSLTRDSCSYICVPVMFFVC